jgi:hypothetical protein
MCLGMGTTICAIRAGNKFIVSALEWEPHVRAVHAIRAGKELFVCALEWEPHIQIAFL